MVKRIILSLMFIASVSLQAMGPSTSTSSSSSLVDASFPLNVSVEDMPTLIASIDGFSDLKKDALRIIKNQMFSGEKRFEVKTNHSLNPSIQMKFDARGNLSIKDVNTKLQMVEFFIDIAHGTLTNKILTEPGLEGLFRILPGVVYCEELVDRTESIKKTISGSAASKDISISSANDTTTITFPDSIRSIATSYDGTRWGVWCANGKFYLCDAVTNQQTHRIKLPLPVGSVALNCDGTYLAVGSNDVAYIIDVKTGKTVYTIVLRNEKAIKSLAFNFDTTQLATRFGDGKVCFFDLDKDTPRAAHCLNEAVSNLTLKEYELLRMLDQATCVLGHIHPTHEQWETWKSLQKKLPAMAVQRFTRYMYDAQAEERKAHDEHFSGLYESCAMQ